MLVILVNGSGEQRKKAVQKYVDDGFLVVERNVIKRMLIQKQEIEPKKNLILEADLDQFEGAIVGKLLTQKYNVVINHNNKLLPRRMQIIMLGEIYGSEVIAHIVEQDVKSGEYFPPIAEEGYSEIRIDGEEKKSEQGS